MADELDALYALPLEEFTAARNELAKRLGDPSIKQLQKPTVPAWAVNQLARRREVDVRRLLRAGEQLEEAQKDVVRGGEQKAFERARRDERDAVRRLRAEAAELLRAGGHAASDATLERVAKTLHAAAGSEDGRALLRDGRLTEELEPQGFEAFAALAGSISPRQRSRSKPSREPSAADRRRAQKAREDAGEARREADLASVRLAEVERELEQARRAAQKAAEKAGSLEAKARELDR